METYIIIGTHSGTHSPNEIEDFDFDKMKPGDERMEKILSTVGGKWLHGWSTLGRFDFLAVVEVPNADAIRAVAVWIHSKSGAKTETIRAFDDNDDVSEFVKYAKKLQATMKE